MFQRFGSAWIPVEKKYFGRDRRHSCPACCISSSDLKDLPPIASLSDPKTWKSLGDEIWWVLRIWKTLKNRSRIVVIFERAVWDRALSCWSKTPVLRSLRRLDLVADAGDSLGDLHRLHLSQCSPWARSAPKLPLVYSKESQRNLSLRLLCAEFFRFWWGGMAPFFASFLGFQLVVVDIGFISPTNST